LCLFSTTFDPSGVSIRLLVTTDNKLEFTNKDNLYHT